ncbi:hypothetical protein PISL3812_06469 [Talaromyces islandicus]|uniref:Uncharacterized protein n=1 Tax=Talaromyces islandicus TaxID=28573 RepID=A0A0U1M1J1_TALIS|nr:hypothetical protein PISL3812_06469 [Talaromyces islandicus]
MAPLATTTQKPVVHGTSDNQVASPNGPKSKKNRRKAAKKPKNEKKPEPQGAKETKEAIPPRTRLPFVDLSLPGTAKTTRTGKTTPLKTDTVPSDNKVCVQETQAKELISNIPSEGVFRVPRHKCIPDTQAKEPTSNTASEGVFRVPRHKSVPETQAKKPASNTASDGVFRVPRYKSVPESKAKVIFLSNGGFYYPILKPGSKFGAFNLPSSSPIEMIEVNETDYSNWTLPQYPVIKPEENV